MQLFVTDGLRCFNSISASSNVLVLPHPEQTVFTYVRFSGPARSQTHGRSLCLSPARRRWVASVCLQCGQAHYVVDLVVTKWRCIITTGWVKSFSPWEATEVWRERAAAAAAAITRHGRHLISLLSVSSSRFFLISCHGVYFSPYARVCIFMSLISVTSHWMAVRGLFRHSVTPLPGITEVHLCQKVCLSLSLTLCVWFLFHSIRWLLFFWTSFADTGAFALVSKLWS